MLVQHAPEHEINLRGAPYELVPEYLVNSLLVLMTRPRRALHLCNLFRVSLLTNMKFEDSDQIRFYHTGEFSGFLSLNNNYGYSYNIIKFLEMEHFNDRGKTTTNGRS